jgi:hypothetical protein
VRLVDVLSAILAETSAFVFTNAACLEIDTFYQALERECRQYDMWELRVSLPPAIAKHALMYNPHSGEAHQGEEVAERLL